MISGTYVKHEACAVADGWDPQIEMLVPKGSEEVGTKVEKLTSKPEEKKGQTLPDEGQGSFFAAASRSSTRKGSSTRRTTVAPLL